MRRSIAPLALFVTLIGVALPAWALTPVHLWSSRYGSVSTDAVTAAAVDASGNVTLAGSFSGTVDFGGGGLVSAGSTDIFIAKYNAAGIHQWSKRIGGLGADAAQAVALDGSGNPVITGYHTGAVDFGGGVLPNFGGRDFFVAKYVGTGTYQWAQGYGSTPTDEGRGVVVDGMANVYVTGLFSMNATFGGATLMSAGLTDIFLAKYNTAGIHQWSVRFGSTNADEGNGVALDASGNVVMTGMFDGTVNFGGGNRISAGIDVILAKYNSSGTHQWSQNFGSVSDDRGLSVATDAASNVFMTGFFSGAADFGGGILPGGSPALFVAKYNSAGTHQWSKQASSMSGATGRSVSIDNASNVLLTGNFASVANFGGSNLSSVGFDDVVIAKYTNAGVHKWSYAFGSSSSDAGVAVVADPSRNVFLAGNFNLSINFGGSALNSAGLQDMFLAKFAGEAQQPLVRSISDIGNDQGRQVLIDFTASGSDQPGSAVPILQYEAYRRVTAPPPSAISMDQLSTAQLMAEGWTQVAAIAAHGETGYTLVAPTIGDSTIANGQYRSAFYIRAASASPYIFYDSPVDSGYSLDNLAPAVPMNFVFDAGDLSWNESPAADFDYFTVYGSNTDSFGAAAVVDYSVAPGMDVTASPYVFYFVTATDFSGNEGKPARINTLTGAGGTPSSYVLSVRNYPNPFNPRTTVSYTVPSRGVVTVAVYDVGGARVATLLDKVDRAAGVYSMEWDGHADNGTTVSSGVYFARIEHSSGTRTKKMVLLK